ncbi:uncharacterized protein DS421_2g39400 [Arachis hypogaea]|nr:uncharacterized protein DS421_2g39400 [Arachis hypogaea]
MDPQSSSQGSRSSTKSHGRRRTCFCGERPVLRTSSTAENQKEYSGDALSIYLVENR